ncbi:MAG: phosphomannomutase/phosphoglucomutase [Mariprofundaceae bacterium]|nr:phosphomannomutase/phosphoglucomutase [Mariprofundaceae bacterium]
MPHFPHHIFREYDIRGIAGQDIDEAFAYQLGKAYTTLLHQDKKQAIAIAHDARLSSPVLHQAVIQGVNAMGFDVLDLGMQPSPLAYFAVFHCHVAGCIIITASHNPSPYNGFKFMVGKESLHGKSIQDLYQTMQQNLLEPQQHGTSTALDIQPLYENFVSESCPISRPLKVVIDAGNGPSGIVAAPLFRKMGCEVTELYCQPDGHFPNHHPDPSVEENLADLKAKVIEEHADLGIAFDGDGDRIGVVDEQGHMIWNDLLLLILAKDLLKKHPGSTIISEIKSSNRLYHAVEEAGGTAIMWRTGHSPIKAKMKETGAKLAGEMSGHIFYADQYDGFDDAIYAGVRLMQIIAESMKNLSYQLRDIPHTETTPEIRIPCADERKFKLVEEAKNYFRNKGYNIIDVDGMRIQDDESWGLLRASNTQAALTLRFEAPNTEKLREIQQLIQVWLDKQGNIT